MNFHEYKHLIFSDLYRTTGVKSVVALTKQLVLGESFKYTFWMRTCKYAEGRALLRYTIFPIARLILRKYTYKLGMSISFRTEIGSGLYIGHFGGIFVHPQSRIGKNCNISHEVTIGQSNRGKNIGVPSIGDNVFLGPGAKIFGSVTVGNNAAIGANSVVTQDVPENAVVVGAPGRVISWEGSKGYINNTDYESRPYSAASAEPLEKEPKS